MIRNTATAVVIAVVSLAGLGTAASAQSVSVTPNQHTPGVLRCVGATQHKAAQASRIQALQSDLGALNARLSVAQQNNKSRAVARIQSRIETVTARTAKVQANQASFAAKCP